MRSERAFGAALSLLLVACGGAAAQDAPDPALVRAQAAQQAAETRAREAEAELAVLRAELKRTAARLLVAEQRLGLRPFEPQTLKRPTGDLTLEPGRAKRLASPDARPKDDDARRALKQAPVTLVAYWATWCEPCIAADELAAVRRVEAAARPFGAALMSVAVDGLDKVRAHPRAADWIYPLWQRDDAHLQWAPRAFVQQAGLGLPLFLVVDRGGAVRFWRNGKLDAQVEEELITALARAAR